MFVDPLVSIIIPVYNGANFLEQAIISALNQSYDNIEIIVINDGSNDNGETEKIALKYIGRIKYFKKNNGGVSSALNYGILKMQGEYFSWLSHDDLYLADKIRLQIESLREFEFGSKIISYTDCSLINSLGRIMCKIVTPSLSQDQHPQFTLFAFGPMHGCSVLIKKHALLEIGGFNEAMLINQDLDLWMRLAMQSYRFIKVDKHLVLGRVHKMQIGKIKLDSVKKEMHSFTRAYFFQLQNNIDENPKYVNQLRTKLLQGLLRGRCKQLFCEELLNYAKKYGARATFFSVIYLFNVIMKYLIRTTRVHIHVSLK